MVTIDTRPLVEQPVRKRIAFVVQRYGQEVCGGAELHCRWVAEHLTDHADVEVLTTCALEHMPWDNYYKPGETMENGVLVRRFALDQLRHHRPFDLLSRRVFGELHSILDELEWIRMLGPHSTDLLRFLTTNQDAYDCFIFFTYQYFTTVFGLPIVARRAALIPTAHDDPTLRLDAYNPVFLLPRIILYNTDTERRVVEQRFGNATVPWLEVGTGIDLPAAHPSGDDFRREFGIDGPILLSVGRIEPNKGSHQLFEFFKRYKDSGQAPDLKLVLMGRATMPIPKRPDVFHLGFVSEETKFAGIDASTVVALPSEHESLSMINLEAWLCDRPVLANGHCDVLVDNCLKANGGLYYTSYEEFAATLGILLANNDLCATLGRQGREYVERTYSWPSIVAKYERAIGFISDDLGEQMR